MGDFDEWKQGGKAFHAGKLIEENPYKKDTINYIDWRDGWIEAEDGTPLEWFN